MRVTPVFFLFFAESALAANEGGSNERMDFANTAAFHSVFEDNSASVMEGRGASGVSAKMRIAMWTSSSVLPSRTETLVAVRPSAIPRVRALEPSESISPRQCARLISKGVRLLNQRNPSGTNAPFWSHQTSKTRSRHLCSSTSGARSPIDRTWMMQSRLAKTHSRPSSDDGGLSSGRPTRMLRSQLSSGASLARFFLSERLRISPLDSKSRALSS